MVVLTAIVRALCSTVLMLDEADSGGGAGGQSPLVKQRVWEARGPQHLCDYLVLVARLLLGSYRVASWRPLEVYTIIGVKNSILTTWKCILFLEMKTTGLGCVYYFSALEPQGFENVHYF